MKRFKDAAGRTWEIDLSIGDVRQFKKQTAIDLFEIITGDLAARLVRDPELLAGVLHDLVAPQIATAGIDEIAFAAGLGGDAMSDGYDAITEEIIELFPRGEREKLRAALAWKAATQTKALAAVDAWIADPEKSEKLADDVKRTLEELMFGSGSTRSPGSSESTPSP